MTLFFPVTIVLSLVLQSCYGTPIDLERRSDTFTIPNVFHYSTTNVAKGLGRDEALTRVRPALGLACKAISRMSNKIQRLRGHRSGKATPEFSAWLDALIGQTDPNVDVYKTYSGSQETDARPRWVYPKGYLEAYDRLSNLEQLCANVAPGQTDNAPEIGSIDIFYHGKDTKACSGKIAYITRAKNGRRSVNFCKGIFKTPATFKDVHVSTTVGQATRIDVMSLPSMWIYLLGQLVFYEHNGALPVRWRTETTDRPYTLDTALQMTEKFPSTVVLSYNPGAWRILGNVVAFPSYKWDRKTGLASRSKWDAVKSWMSGGKTIG